MPVQPFDRVGHGLKTARDPTGERFADFFERQVRLAVKAGVQLRQSFVREGGLAASPPAPWSNRSFLLSPGKQLVNPTDGDLELIGYCRDRLAPAITRRYHPLP
jgi:hypothetical protein